MSQGEIQQVADPVRLYRHPANRFVAGFIGSPPMNFFSCELAQKGNALFFQDGLVCLCVDAGTALRLKEHAGKRVILGIRPEHVNVVACARNAAPEGAVEVRVEVIERMGPETYLYLVSGAHSLVARVPPAARAEVSQTVSVIFEMAEARFFEPETGAKIA